LVLLRVEIARFTLGGSSALRRPGRPRCCGFWVAPKAGACAPAPSLRWARRPPLNGFAAVAACTAPALPTQTRLCCSDPRLTPEGCYPLRCSMQSGPSSRAPFQLAWAGGCATGLRTRSRHVHDLLFRVLTALTLVGRCFWQRVGQRHGSRLLALRLPFVHSPAVSFLTSPALGSFSRGLPSLRVLPGACAPFVHLSVAFAGRFHV
jgi:hypothetical protein